MSNNNPLLYPPFFPIEGIDPSSPISAQTEQIDQLNTLLLQEIDANFARFHQIVTSRILPEIKRFAIAGEPTREVALFWRSFFETASSIRLPGAGESTIEGGQGQDHPDTSTAYDDHTLTMRREEDSYGSRIHEEGSFIFDPPPGVGVSSTPLPAGRNGGGINQSWEDSMESPFDRLDRQLREDLKIDGRGNESRSSSDMPTPSLPSGYSLPGLTAKDFSQLSSLHEHEGHSTGTVGMDQLSLNEIYTKQQQQQRQQQRPSSATPKATSKRQLQSASNPFGAGFSGIADMRNTPLNPKSRSKSIRSQAQTQASGRPSTSSAAALAELELEDDSDDDEIPFGMSPPVTMNFTLPPRAQAVLNVAKANTPAKSRTPRPNPSRGGGGGTGEKEAKHILDDLLEEMGSELSPRLDTPEGLGRYSVLPSELEGQGRLLFSSGNQTQGQGQRQTTATGFDEDDENEDEDQTFHGTSASASGSNHGVNLGLPPNLTDGGRPSIANTTYGGADVDDSVIQIQPDQVIYSTDGSFGEADNSFDSNSDSDGGTYATGTGTMQGTVQGSGSIGIGSGQDQYRIMSGSENGVLGDISYLSSEGDLSMTSEAGVVFGRAAPLPLSHLHSQGQGQGPSMGLGQTIRDRQSLAGNLKNNKFNLMKQDEMDTYHGGRLEDAGDDLRLSPTAALGRHARN